MKVNKSITWLGWLTLVSSVSAQFSTLAIPWFVLESTGSATRASILFSVQIITMILVGVPSGAVVARLGVRKTLIIAQSLLVPQALALPILHNLGMLSFEVIVAISVIDSAISPAYSAGINILIAELCDEDLQRLAEANSTLSAYRQVGAVIGRLGTGFLIAAIGTLNVMYLDAVANGLELVILLLVIPASLGRAAIDPDDYTFKDDLRGVRFIFADVNLRRVVFWMLVVNTVFVISSLGIPVIFQSESGDSRLFGIAMTVGSLAMLCGALLTRRLLASFSQKSLAAVGAFGVGISLLGPALLPPQAGAMIMLTILGLAQPMLTAPTMAVINVYPPKEAKPYVLTAFTTLSMLTMPLGAMIWGPMMDNYPINIAFLAAGTLCLITVFFLVNAIWGILPKVSSTIAQEI